MCAVLNQVMDGMYAERAELPVAKCRQSGSAMTDGATSREVLLIKR